MEKNTRTSVVCWLIRLEEAWKHCRKELVERKHDHGNNEATHQFVLHCITTKTSINKHGSARHLLADSPATSPSPSSSPSPSPSPAIAGGDHESPSHDTKPPHHSPSRDDSPSGDGSLPPDNDLSPPSPPHSHKRHPPPSSSDSPPPAEPDNTNHQPLKLTFIAAVTVFVIAALLIICLCWSTGSTHKKDDPIDQQKVNVVPTVTLASADVFSVPHKSSVVLVDKSDKKESTMMNNEGLIANIEGGGSLLTTDIISSSTGEIMHVADPPLKTPPGKVALSPPLSHLHRQQQLLLMPHNLHLQKLLRFHLFLRNQFKVKINNMATRVVNLMLQNPN